MFFTTTRQAALRGESLLRFPRHHQAVGRGGEGRGGRGRGDAARPSLQVRASQASLQHTILCIFFAGDGSVPLRGTAAAALGLLRSGLCAGRPSPLKVSCWRARKTQKVVLSVENVWQLEHCTIESTICRSSLSVSPDFGTLEQFRGPFLFAFTPEFHLFCEFATPRIFLILLC